MSLNSSDSFVTYFPNGKEWFFAIDNLNTCLQANASGQYANTFNVRIIRKGSSLMFDILDPQSDGEFVDVKNHWLAFLNYLRKTITNTQKDTFLLNGKELSFDVGYIADLKLGILYSEKCDEFIFDDQINKTYINGLLIFDRNN